jgi:DNA-directed RNA polymerase subunit RPC12/RpoP
MARKSTGKKTRFEVFKRDGFACSYCGKTPPAVILEVDHIIPLAEGGPDDLLNLTTACMDCNRGKGSRPLTELPESVESRLELMQEKREQVRLFERLVASERRKTERSIDKVEAILLRETNHHFTDNFRSSVRMFLSKLPLPTVLDAAEKATRWRTPNERTKYFCGICWRTIKGDGHARS